MDVTFNLERNTYRPYKKTNDNFTYINTSSNHPPQIIKHLTQTISERLSRNSSSAEIFERSKANYEKALKKCGYKAKLQCMQLTLQQNNTRKGTRKSFGSTHSTPCFPQTNKLNKIFNRNTVKVSYNFTQYVPEIVKRHNKNVTQLKQHHQLECNCRIKTECPLNGDSCKEDVIHKCIQP